MSKKSKSIIIKYINTFSLIKQLFIWLLLLLPVLRGNAEHLDKNETFDDTTQQDFEIPVEEPAPAMNMVFPMRDILCNPMMVNAFLMIDFKNDAMLKQYFYPPET